MTSTQPPSYNSVMQRMKGGLNHSLRPLVIFVSFVGLIYCVVRGASLLKDSTDSAPGLKKADIVLGAIYVALGVFQIGGIAIAIKKHAKMVSLYAKSIIGGGVIVSSLEIAALVVHVKLKEESIQHCRNSLSEKEDQQKVNEWCDSDWKRGVWVHAVWMAVIIVLAAIFIALWWRYKNQLELNGYSRPKDNNSVLLQSSRSPAQPNPRYPPSSNVYMGASGASTIEPDYVPPYLKEDEAPPYEEAATKEEDYRDDKEFQEVDMDMDRSHQPYLSGSGSASSSNLQRQRHHDNVV
ncbi:hypothetical protein E3P81_03011 [Wallemia ichthyophaga]|nr:hypothetical protein E3P97_03208 [Wallemia ichthyophaga]TIB05322.1 hypothetical protein E3P96_01203 [Wallemia ichthyophaga]TIB29161.1 hypothetical protein E3P85_03302 [Wallemia ichthyophaga]TIB45059.1 hypothetical protein E3P82_03071 [Wallemia ichthyophaga]TIB48085.1 hypothetical protein E3P81_03011 [Wallemia ichthyophaga]